MLRRSLVLVFLFSVLVLVPGTASAAPQLRAGAGQADITPPQTGYFLGGWTRADRLGLGVSTRLYANSLVLQRGKRKLALVAVELFAVPAGLQQAVAEKLATRGFKRSSVLIAASHTHSAPGGFANNPTYNTAAPSVETIDDPLSFYKFFAPEPTDTQLYTFLVNQIAESVIRADADRAPAAAGWGHGELVGLTQNRSIEAHLANHGIKEAPGEGSPDQDPEGPVHTIDPAVDVLRVDKLKRIRQPQLGGVRRKTRRIPIGAWSTFANHGTVVHSELQAFSGDHHAAAWRRFSARVRKAGHVPAKQTVVNVYPNADEGDQTAGIVNVGPAAAQRVGNVEADAMFKAWRAAGKHLKRKPALAGRWTVACFCDKETATGPVDATGQVGAGFLTGSEEGRGPLYDITGQSLEGRTSASSTPKQGNKVVLEGVANTPPAVPVAVWRIANRAIATVPGEATKETGVRIKTAVENVLRPQGVKGVAIAGLALEFVQYVSTPEEYGQQSYEGASSLYGPNEGTFLQERLAELAQALVTRKAAPKPFEYDATYGVKPDGAPYPPGAESASITQQPPAQVERLTRATMEWTGGPLGNDRPVDKVFITAERQVGSKWVRFADDLGAQFLWRADDQGHYSVQWEVPLTAKRGTYRLRVSANRYGFTSTPFAVVASTALTVESVPGGVRLAYRKPVVNVDLTTRPEAANGGKVGTLKKRRGTVFPVASGTSIPAGGARDRFGNTNAVAFTAP